MEQMASSRGYWTFAQFLALRALTQLYYGQHRSPDRSVPVRYLGRVGRCRIARATRSAQTNRNGDRAHRHRIGCERVTHTIKTALDPNMVGMELSRNILQDGSKMVFSGLGFGIYGLANKALAANTDTPTILLPMLTIAVAITGGLAATQFEARAEPTLASLVAAAALGLIGTGGSFILISEGMKRLSAALVGTITALTPIGQIMLAHLVLNEPLTWILAMGGGLILVGVLSMIYAENAQVREEVLR